MDRSSAEPSLRVRLFGPPSFEIDGSPPGRLRSRRMLWMLAYLLLREGCEVDRSFLAALLWPDTEESTALATLRRGLTDLRTALGRVAPFLSSSGRRTLRFLPGGADVDVLRFDRAVVRGDRGSLEEAVALYRGPLLQGCCEEWVFEERRARAWACLQALQHLAQLACERGEPQTAVGYLRRAIELEPLHEPLHRSLMQALADAGSYAAALEAYRTLRSRLRAEVNSEPDPETVALFTCLRDDARQRGARSGRMPAGGPVSVEPVRTVTGSAVETQEKPADPSPVEAPASGHLPRPLTRFIGRSEELRRVQESLRNARLVTLTGTGGVGKTRLAIQTALGLEGCFPDGGWFVELAAQSDPAVVPQVVATTLGVRQAASQSTLHAVLRAVGSQRMLIILDNCEHLLDACASFAFELLGQCPHVRVLATSRQALGITGEALALVPPLPFPEGETREISSNTEALLQWDAVRLLTERAAAAVSGFRLSPQNAPALLQICRRLDGIPLALELAAARLQVLTAQQVAERLDDRFRLLTVGSRTALPRHQTLEAALDWSYGLLKGKEACLFRRLSVFAGWFDLDAAETICGDDLAVSTGESGVLEFPPGDETLGVPGAVPVSPTLRGTEVLDLLQALVDHSLVIVEERGGEPGYRLLETTREYARRALVLEGDEERRRERHAAYFASCALRAARHFRTEAEESWLRHIEDRLENLRGALEWLTRPDASPLHRETALCIPQSLSRLWWLRGYWAEGRRWLLQSLEASRERTFWRANVLADAAALAISAGEFGVGRGYAREAEAIYKERDEREHLANLKLLTGWAAFHEEDYDTARQECEQGLTWWRNVGDRARTAAALNDLGNAAAAQEDFAAAERYYREARELHEALGDRISAAWTINNLGDVALAAGDLARATPLHLRALQTFGELRHPVGTSECLRSLGLGLAEHDPSRRGLIEAVQLLAAADRIRDEVGVQYHAYWRRETDRRLERFRQLLGAETFEKAWRQGRCLEAPDAVTRAQDVCGDSRRNRTLRLG